MIDARVGRRQFLRRATATTVAAFSLAHAGCTVEGTAQASHAKPELVWGVHGVLEGRLHRPRVAAIDSNDELYIADLTDRIQVFDRDGHFQRSWRTPGLNIDGPSGLFVDHLGRVLVADTHFYRVLIYSRQGELMGQVGDGVQGSTEGRFGFPTDVIIDNNGYYYVSEYGDFDRIQVFDPRGHFVRQWGGHGYEPGQFLRPRAIDLDESERLFVADSCNHRIQVFDTRGRLLYHWGERGSAPGQMAYPFDLALAPGDALFVCEYGNSRVQKFTRDGKSLGLWGGPGQAPGQLNNPCALAVDSQGVVHVIDSMNHRVQRVRI